MKLNPLARENEIQRRISVVMPSPERKKADLQRTINRLHDTHSGSRAAQIRVATQRKVKVDAYRNQPSVRQKLGRWTAALDEARQQRWGAALGKARGTDLGSHRVAAVAF